MRASAPGSGYPSASRSEKRSSCASGSGNVPSCSIGFWVAITKKGAASGRATPSTVTWRSCMHSSNADCVRGDARLSSSASTMLANTGPGRKPNSLVRWSNTLTPVTSLGSTSGVSWIRANEQSSERASARASVVLPTPGTSSTSTCPSASSATTARSTMAGSPLTASRDVRDHAQRRVTRALEWMRLCDCDFHRTHRTPGRASSGREISGAEQLLDPVEHGGRDRALGRARHLHDAVGSHERNLVVVDVEADVGP